MNTFTSVTKRDDGSSTIVITIDGKPTTIKLNPRDTVALLNGLNRTVRPGSVCA